LPNLTFHENHPNLARSIGIRRLELMLSMAMNVAGKTEESPCQSQSREGIGERRISRKVQTCHRLD